MKSPEEYVAAQVPAGRVVCSITEAAQAVAQALVDAERYKELLLASLRNSKPQTPEPGTLTDA
ncbi:hypothetical protein [Hymenobacter algoricola]|uniref:Uncharacterized protein n=1 Tax=Hymenobacter algoricola TaxID=486267 RepID=A0ABP7NBP3_9BACT